MQAEIQLLEKKLLAQDKSDAAPQSENSKRLQFADFEASHDPAQLDLLKALREKVLVYGNLNDSFCDLSSNTMTRSIAP